MTTVVTLTGLSVNTLIQVKVRAHNQDGWGAYSELNVVGATIETVPGTPAAPSYDATASSNS